MSITFHAAPPAYRTALTDVQVGSEGGLPKWSSAKPLPVVGAVINVGSRLGGKGTVTGYFIEDGFVGVVVRPHSPPAWWVKQLAEVDSRLAPEQRGRYTLFGAELPKDF